MSEERFKELARRLAERTGELRRLQAPPQLRVVPAALPASPPRRMNAIDRESHIRIIKHHRRFFGLQILVDQACIGFGGLDDLPDEAVIQLHKDIDRARECIADGVSLEDAGLIRACA